MVGLMHIIEAFMRPVQGQPTPDRLLWGQGLTGSEYRSDRSHSIHPEVLVDKLFRYLTSELEFRSGSWLKRKSQEGREAGTGYSAVQQGTGLGKAVVALFKSGGDPRAGS
jgi:hypothetical protein